MSVIDAHVHVWDRSRAKYDWMNRPGVAGINRDLLVPDLLLNAKGTSVNQFILVQAADNDDDTDTMVSQADEYSAVAGVVVWLPLDQPQRAAERLATLQRGRNIVGVRSLLHERGDSRWIFDAKVQEGLRLLENAGLAFDYVVANARALSDLARLAEAFPALTFVLDHLGAPALGSELGEWRSQLRDLASAPNLFAKASGLYPVDLVSVRPILDFSLETFGAHRLMFGSDWPINELFGGYHRWWDAITSLTADFSVEDRTDFFGGTAERAYRLSHSQSYPNNSYA